MPVRLFVGNLPYSATEADLRELFSQVGEPARVSIPVDRETGRPRGFAFVEFVDSAMGEAAIGRFNGQQFQGRTIAVNEARPKGERPPMGSGPPPSYGPRPAGGGFGGGGFAGGGGGMRPSFNSGGGGGGGAAAGRQFRGPDREPARRRDTKAARKRNEGGPKGPIRERQTGRVYDVSAGDEDEVDLTEIEATSEIETTTDIDDEKEET